MISHSLNRAISIAARSSLLSQAQVLEVHAELSCFYPQITFETHLIESRGDLDQKTSLRTLDKSDFFTREIDQSVIDGRARVAVHSAKDLPDPLAEGLMRVALTQGVDPSDVVVLREGEALQQGAIVATSSMRREEMVRAIRDDVCFVDIRGTIEKRLEKLFRGEVDGVVIALAALIRLGLMHLNWVTLPGETAPFQGRLAVLVRYDDEEMQELFGVLDA